MSSLPETYEGDDFYCDVALPHVDLLSVVHDGPGVLAYHHTRPHWKTHIVVVPKRHVRSLTTLTDQDEALVRELLAVLKTVSAMVEEEDGAAMVLTNLGAYQDSKHLHVHVASGKRIR